MLFEDYGNSLRERFGNFEDGLYELLADLATI